MTKMPEHREIMISSEDGDLLVRDWGPEGLPVVMHHHGTPSSGSSIPAGWAAVGSSGVRLVTFDRPGYGRSANRPGRRIADAATCSEQIADALGIGEFAVMGTSGGGPHAAATAALLRDRITRLCVSVGLGPVELPGFDASEGMLVETKDEIAAARAGESVLRSYIDGYMALDEPLDAWLRQLPASDVEILGRADVVEESAIEDLESMGEGIEGWLEDDMAIFARPWGCDLTQISARTVLLYGEVDVLVPASHGPAFRQAIGHGQVVVAPDTGHWMRNHEPAVLRWLGGLDGEAELRL